jgi:hypothetical protein
MRSEFDGFHSMRFSRCIVIYLPTSRNIWGYLGRYLMNLSVIRVFVVAG